jgi:hypothetical protein
MMRGVNVKIDRMTFPRRESDRAFGAVSVGAVSVGAVSFGAVSVGAVSLGSASFGSQDRPREADCRELVGPSVCDFAGGVSEASHIARLTSYFAVVFGATGAGNGLPGAGGAALRGGA